MSDGAPVQAVVLAGERPGGSALARELELPAGVLAPLAGQPCLQRVLETLADARSVSGGVVCGPAAAVLNERPELRGLLERTGFRWQAPAAGPAASALEGVDACGTFPLLLTSGDHGLLRAATVERFCRAAAAWEDADLVVGLVPHQLVKADFPHSRRTLLAFAGGAWCGSNLFWLQRAGSRRALRYWAALEADRKRPWKLVRRLGPLPLLRYLLGRLPLEEALDRLSEQSGCRIRAVPVEDPRAAVDIDSVADWSLADQLLRNDAMSSDT